MFSPMPNGAFRIPSWRDLERLAFEGRISVSELCRRAEVHGTTFRKWKAGRSSPTVATVQALLDAGLAAVAEAERAEAQSPAATPTRSRRKAAAKPRGRGAKAAAAKRPARRRA
jgi:hypothetical protein